MIQMPDGSPIEIKDLSAEPLLAEFTNPLDHSSHVLKVPRSELKFYFDVSSASFRAYFQPTLDALGSLNGPSVIDQCSAELASACQLKGSEADTRRSFLATMLVTCEPSAGIEIVKRSEVLSNEEFRKSCSGASVPLPAVSAGTWPAPVPPVLCTSAEAAIIKANEVKKHNAYLASCPAREANFAKLGLIMPEPECLLPSEKAKIKKIVLHSSEGSPNASPRALFCDYAKGGFKEIPYHFYIARDRASGHWKVFEGRSLKYQGAHVRANLNSDSIGIAIAGDYQVGGPSPAHPFAKSEAPPAEAVQLAQSLVAQLKKLYPGIANIQGHGEALFEGDHCQKDCPGPGAQFVVQRLREKFFAEGNK
jgi:N-acetyl-anhydromuramyl-L-alanine amidase AmpD